MATVPKWSSKYLNQTKYKGGPNSNHPKFIVLHGTGGDRGGDLSVLRGLTSRQVSVQFYITQVGEIFYLVSIDRVAWHAGVSSYAGVTSLNDDSIGIELENRPGEKWTEAQLDSLDNVIRWIDNTLHKKLPIVTHKMVAMPRGRKVDPTRFTSLTDYQKYRDHDPKVDDEYDSKPIRKFADGQLLTVVSAGGANIVGADKSTVVKHVAKGGKLRSAKDQSGYYLSVHTKIGPKVYYGFILTKNVK